MNLFAINESEVQILNFAALLAYNFDELTYYYGDIESIKGVRNELLSNDQCGQIRLNLWMFPDRLGMLSYIDEKMRYHQGSGSVKFVKLKMLKAI